FGPGGSTVIVECLTDNVNRSVSELRAVINKTHIKMGAIGSVSYMYDNNSIISFKGMDLEQAMEVLIEADIDLQDIENQDDQVVIYGLPNDLFKIKKAILKVLPNVIFETEEIAMIPKETITLAEEDLVVFKKMLAMFDEVEDVQNVYHNVNL
ncbi:MAG: YebC/PmpR family DNA-binding transcriptional regulator, partial [Bacilli bacterium]